MSRSITITVPAANVPSTQAGFPLFIDLADLGDDFWDYVSEDGHDIRMKTTGEIDLPFDLIYFVREERIGALRVKVTLSATVDTSVVLHYASAGLSWVLPTDPNGRNAVYTGFHRVLSFLDSLYDRTGSGNKMEFDAGFLPLLNQSAAITGDTTCHQGVCFDRENNVLFTIGTNLINRYTWSGSAWTLDKQNTDPNGDAGDVNHCGAGFYRDGKLYIPQSFDDYAYTKLSEYDAETLALIRTRNITAPVGDYPDGPYWTAGVTWVPALNCFVFCEYYNTGTKFFKHADDDDLTFLGTIDLSSALTQLQGITWWRGAFWVTKDDDNYLYRVSIDGTEINRVFYLNGYTYIEGLQASGNKLFLLASNAVNHGVVFELTPWTKYGPAAGLYNPNANTTNMSIAATRYTEWSLGLTARITARTLTQTQMFCNYQLKNSGDSAKRESLGFGSVQGKIGVWNSTDLWLYRDPLTDEEFAGVAYVDNFSTHTVDAAPTGWTERWNTGAGTCTIRNDGGVYGRNSLEYIRANTGTYAISIDAIGTAEDDAEVLALVYINTNSDNKTRIYVRGGGAVGSENGYFAYMQPTADSIGIQKYAAGASTNLGSKAKTVDYGVWYYMRFRVVGTALKFKTWEKGTAEPAAWDLEVTDAALSAGWVGLGGNSSAAGENNYDFFAVSTGANPVTIPLCKDDTEITNHVAISHNGTTARTLYHNGQAYVDSGCAERPTSDANVVSFGAPYSISQAMTGMIEWFWMASSVVSADWLTTDYENVINHTTFYTIGAGEATPDLSAATGEILQPIADQAAYDLQPYIERDLADEVRLITDTISAILATSRVETVVDEIKVILDDPAAILEPGLAGVTGDTLQVIRDSITYGLINLTQPQRWVAPTTITPKTNLIDPIYLAAHPVRHPSIYFEPRVKSYGAFTRAISAPVGFVKTGDVTLSVLDPDNVLKRKISVKTIKKATVDMRLGPEGGSYRSFLRPWRRRVYNVSQPSDGILNFNLKDNVFDMLERSYPVLIHSRNFTNLPANLSSTWANIIVGAVSGTNGAIPCRLVDTVNFRYLVHANPSKSVDGVFRRIASPEPGGPEWEQVGAGEYSVVQTTYLDNGEGGGSYGTILQFYADQGSQEIRANVTGCYDPSTGDLRYTNFADYLLSIFEYLAQIENRTDVINLASFEETRDKVADLVCAGAVTEKITYGELITRIQRSSNIDVFADKNDRIAIHYTGDDDEPSIDLDHVKHFYGGTVSQEMADPVYNRFKYKYAPNFAAGSWTDAQYDNLEDQEAVQDEVMEDPEELQMFFVRDANTADSVIRHRAGYCRLESFKFHATIPMIPVLEELELADLVRITHFAGMAPLGYSRKQFKIMKLVMDIDKLTYQLEGIVRKLPPPNDVITNVDDSGNGGNDDSSDSRKGLTQATGGAAYNCRCGPWSRGTEGEYFALFRDGSDSSRLLMCYTNNYGFSWYVADDTHAPYFTAAQGGLLSFDACKNDAIDDDTIHVACQAYFGRVVYCPFNMRTKTWGSVEEINASSDIYGLATVSIDCRYPGGEPLVFFQGNRRPGTLYPGTLRARAYYSMKTAGAWTSPILVTPDGLLYSFWSFGSMDDDCDCRAERVIAGRDNRMHFFFNTDQGYQQYWLTMNGNRTFNEPPIKYVYGYQNAPLNVNALLFKDRTRIALFQKRDTHMRARILTEGSELAVMASNNLSEGNKWISAPVTTASKNPPGFFGYDATAGKLYCVLGQQYPGGRLRIMESSNDGLTWSASKAVDPDGGLYVVTGNIFTIGKEPYLATFGSETWNSSSWPRWIWKRISTIT